ncbi:protocatechuate 3,4-dioxygenase subunit alpha [Phenylobacterium sp. LjRoot225]|uniref:protocatechuate 3,4-dioxygenase subunit alpha n=1 Tax=Phenylobacterium sp. LjRoot225 TaxID=3342285 RepID=UPI003ECE6151
MTVFKQTPWQTVGPFFHYALPWKGAADLVAGEGDLGARPDLIPEGHDLLGPGDVVRTAAQGEAVEIFGCVYDGDGQPIPDAMVEIWQANPQGRYASEADPREELALDPNFIGFGRSSTSVDGAFRFRTLKPGRVPGPGNTLQAPHIAVGLMGRGLLKRLVTRIYFADEAANAEDPILALVPQDRRDTLIARYDGGAWRFDIHLQGEAETVFFEI